MEGTQAPFPLGAFPGVKSPAELRNARQRVRVYGVFAQTYSYRPRGASLRPEKDGEISLPYFVVLHVDPIPELGSTPLLQNPFFLVWISLAVFGAAFFLVMTRMERKESKVINEQALRIRRAGRDRRSAAAGSSPGGASAAGPPPADGGPGRPPS